MERAHSITAILIMWLQKELSNKGKFDTAYLDINDTMHKQYSMSWQVYLRSAKKLIFVHFYK